MTRKNGNESQSVGVSGSGSMDGGGGSFKNSPEARQISGNLGAVFVVECKGDGVCKGGGMVCVRVRG